MKENISQKYDIQSEELTLINQWFDGDVFHWDSCDLEKSSQFVIDTPPPTVSGMLHIGHIYSYTHIDTIARYQRMNGKNVFYPIGFDDNGLPTERLMEKDFGIKVREKYNQESERKIQDALKDYDGFCRNINGEFTTCTKEQFIRVCKSGIVKYEESFEKVFKKVGLSIDWRQKYQTIGNHCTKIAQKSFLELYKNNLIYNKNAPIYWDIVDKTALATAEIEEKDQDTNAHYIKFSLNNNDDNYAVIMTTRPELLPSCLALLYNPSDERYNGKFNNNTFEIVLNNQKFSIPAIDLTKHSLIRTSIGNEVKLIADETVEIEKGTGLVMCCSYGDWKDVEWIQKHKLNARVIIEDNGTINKKEFEKLITFNDFILKNNLQEKESLNINKSRELIVEELKNNNKIITSVAIKNAVKCGERSGKSLEILHKKQWYVKVVEFKNQIQKSADLVKFFPEEMRVKLNNWVAGLKQDWCISRNRYFGISLPVDENDHPIDEKSLPYVSEKSDLVLDTWFTSANTVQINANDFISKERYDALYPATIRPQAHEIIRTWAFYTVTMSHFLSDGKQIPWQNIMLSGWCLASDKTKMSKSKGNVIDPFAILEKYGMDATRYWTTSIGPGMDTSFNESKIIEGLKIINKLWNIQSFYKIHINEEKEILLNLVNNLADNVSNKIDIWLLQSLSKLEEKYHGCMQNFEYHKAKDLVEKFFWNEFCDNWIEIAKVRCYGISATVYQDKKLNEIELNSIQNQQNSALITLHIALTIIIHLLAPFLPCITEKINQEIVGSSIHQRNSFAKIKNLNKSIQKIQNNQENNVQAQQLLETISFIRADKTANKMSLKTQIAQIKLNKNLKIDLFINDLCDVCNIIKDGISFDEMNQIASDIIYNKL